MRKLLVLTALLCLAVGLRAGDLTVLVLSFDDLAGQGQHADLGKTLQMLYPQSSYIPPLSSMMAMFPE